MLFTTWELHTWQKQRNLCYKVTYCNQNLPKQNKKKIVFVKNTSQKHMPSKAGHANWEKAYPIRAGFKSVSTISNIVHFQLLAQSGLVIPDHKGDVTIMLQNKSNVDIQISWFIENLKNDYSKEIS